MLGIFSIFDAAAAAYLPPFFSPTPAVALRAFSSAANDNDHKFHLHASDYTLYQLGEWDPENGAFKILETRTMMGTASQFINQVGPFDAE